MKGFVELKGVDAAQVFFKVDEDGKGQFENKETGICRVLVRVSNINVVSDAEFFSIRDTVAPKQAKSFIGMNTGIGKFVADSVDEIVSKMEEAVGKEESKEK